MRQQLKMTLLLASESSTIEAKIYSVIDDALSKINKLSESEAKSLLTTNLETVLSTIPHPIALCAQIKLRDEFYVFSMVVGNACVWMDKANQEALTKVAIPPNNTGTIESAFTRLIDGTERIHSFISSEEGFLDQINQLVASQGNHITEELEKLKQTTYFQLKNDNLPFKKTLTLPGLLTSISLGFGAGLTTFASVIACSTKAAASVAAGGALLALLVANWPALLITGAAIGILGIGLYCKRGPAHCDTNPFGENFTA